MRATMIPESLLEQRRRLGHDKRDEVWAGVIHMVPPPFAEHQLVSGALYVVLCRIAKRLGLRAVFETGLFDPRAKKKAEDYRVPDLMVASPDVFSKRGIEAKATLVVELLSPNDESRAKLPFYARVGVREVWLVDPATRSVEIFALRDGRMTAVRTRQGVLRSPALGVELATVERKLQIRDGAQLDEL